MTHPHLTEEQGARADALDVAARLLTGTDKGGPLSASSRPGLLPDDLPRLILLAQYVLIGRYAAPEGDDPEELDTIAGTGSAYLDTSDPAASAASDSTEAGYL